MEGALGLTFLVLASENPQFFFKSNLRCNLSKQFQLQYIHYINIVNRPKVSCDAT